MRPRTVAFLILAGCTPATTPAPESAPAPSVEVAQAADPPGQAPEPYSAATPPAPATAEDRAAFVSTLRGQVLAGGVQTDAVQAVGTILHIDDARCSADAVGAILESPVGEKACALGFTEIICLAEWQDSGLGDPFKRTCRSRR